MHYYYDWCSIIFPQIPPRSQTEPSKMNTSKQKWTIPHLHFQRQLHLPPTINSSHNRQLLVHFSKNHVRNKTSLITAPISTSRNIDVPKKTSPNNSFPFPGKNAQPPSALIHHRRPTAKSTTTKSLISAVA